jgi:hypothetical protein
MSAGNADGFIVRFFDIACNEWTAVAGIAVSSDADQGDTRSGREGAEIALPRSAEPAEICFVHPGKLCGGDSSVALG